MDIYRSIADEVSVENMLETNKEIVKYERLSGSSDERQAVEYLKKSWTSMGLTLISMIARRISVSRKNANWKSKGKKYMHKPIPWFPAATLPVKLCIVAIRMN